MTRQQPPRPPRRHPAEWSAQRSPDQGPAAQGSPEQRSPEQGRRRRPRPKSRPAARRAVDPARRTAFEALRAVSEQDAYANLVLPRLLRRAGLTGRDAAFATELAYGALRGRGSYDAVLAEAAGRPVTEIDEPLLDALRLGAHQLLATRVPPHAAVAATVDLVRAEIGSAAAGFANAVLRRVAERDLDGWLADVAPAPEADPDGHLAVAASHPVWIVRALRDALRAAGRGRGRGFRRAQEAGGGLRGRGQNALPAPRSQHPRMQDVLCAR